MNKIITTTLLVAAGTMLAGAVADPTLLAGWDFSKASTSTLGNDNAIAATSGTNQSTANLVIGNGVSLSGGTLSFTGSGVAAYSAGSGSNFGIGPTSAPFTVLVELTAFTRGTGDKAEKLLWTASSGSNGNNNLFRTGVAIGPSSGGSNSSDGKAWGMWQGGSKDRTQGDVSSYFSALDNGTASSIVITAYYSSDGMKLSINGQEIFTDTGLKWSSGAELTEFYLGGWNPASENNRATMSVSKFEVYSGDASAIPEPSAFGLLAGLGALALVASRRRRSRK